MLSSRLLKVLLVFAILSVLLLVFSDKIFQFIFPQKTTLEEESVRKFENNLLNEPNLKTQWTTTSNPSAGYQISYRSIYELFPNNETPKVLDSNKLVRENTVLAVLSLVEKDKEQEFEKAFQDKVSREVLDLSTQDLNLTNKQGKYLIAKKENKTINVLVIVKDQKNNKSFIIEVKNFDKWLEYPSDILYIANSVEFF